MHLLRLLPGSLSFLVMVAQTAAQANAEFPAPESPEPVPGLVAGWDLSPAVRASDLAPERYLDGQTIAGISWLPAQREPSGLVDIARYRKPSHEGTSRAWARTVVRAEQKESRPFAFGFSDSVSVYLNGRILYRGQRDRLQHGPSPAGFIDWHDTVYLPLEVGNNELVLLVSGQSGAWSFGGRDLDAIYRHSSLQDVWDLPDHLSAPESVAYDSGRKVLYVSNFGGDCISQIGLDGTVVALKWVAGLKAPTGLKFFAGKLYAVERSGVAAIDPEQGMIISRLSIADAAFLNDLDVDQAGTIYVTDTFKNCVFRLIGGKSEVWIEGKEVGQPNGILVEKERVLVGVTEDGAIKSVDLQTRKASPFVTLGPGANMDGLVGDGKGGYLFSDYYGRIYRADAAGRKTLLLDRRGPHQYTADFEYIPEEGLLIVPSLFDNRLTAYRLATP